MYTLYTRSKVYDEYNTCENCYKMIIVVAHVVLVNVIHSNMQTECSNFRELVYISFAVTGFVRGITKSYKVLYLFLKNKTPYKVLYFIEGLIFFWQVLYFFVYDDSLSLWLYYYTQQGLWLLYLYTVHTFHSSMRYCSCHFLAKYWDCYTV